MFARLNRYVLCAVAVAALGGCGASLAPRTYSSVAEVKVLRASSGTLLYGSHSCGGLCVFSWPSLQQMGGVTIPSGTSGYLCSDLHGNVFVLPASFSGGTIYEYAHGGTTPIATLNDGGDYGGMPRGCSVDPTSENLAVTNDNAKDGSNIAIYAGASGSPTIIKAGSKLSSIGGCGYDDAGNLYVVGADSGKNFSLAEVPQGSSELSFLTGPALSDFGHVQWVQGKMYVESPGVTPKVYDINVQGSTYAVAGTTTFRNVHELGQAWIYKGKIAAPFSTLGANFSHIGVWKFPAGGTHVARRQKLGYIQGVTISVTP